jgi:hypothetical protein
MLKIIAQKTKTLLLIGSLLLISLSSFGRNFKNGLYDHRLISFNQGYAFSGAGDCWGRGNEISHMKSITPHLFHKETITSWLINGDSWIEEGFNHQSGMGAAFELGISPFKMRNSFFSLTGGSTLTHLISRYPNSGGYHRIGESKKIIVGYTDLNRTLAMGFIMSANYHTQINSRLWLNMRASFQRNWDDDGVTILSIGLGFDPSILKK